MVVYLEIQEVNPRGEAERDKKIAIGPKKIAEGQNIKFI